MTTNLTRWALVLGLGILPLAAQPFGGPGRAGQGGGPRQAHLMGRLAEQLKLTENQKTQIQAIQARHADASKAKVQAAADARKAFQEAAHNPDTTPAQLKSLYQAKSDRGFELMLDRRAMHNEIRAILTPEQRTELDKLQAYRQGMRQGRRGKGGHGMGMGF